MRNTFFVFLLLALLVCAMPLRADEVDDGLPPTVNQRIRAQTREMIQIGVPADAALKMTRSMVQEQFRNELTLEAQNEVINACREGLPYGPLLNKLQEGLSKQVPPEHIVQAMKIVHERYEYTYRYAGQVTTDKVKQNLLAEAMAQGLAAGLKTRDMDQINDRIRDRIRLKTCDDCPELALESALTARDMARLGVTSDTTGDVVCQALENKYDGPAMVRMRNQFRTRLNHEDPQEMANRYAKSFRNGQDPADAENSSGLLGGGQQNQGGTAGGSNGSGSGGSGGRGK